MTAQEKAYHENTYGKEGDPTDLRKRLSENAEVYLERLKEHFEIEAEAERLKDAAWAATGAKP